MLARNKCVSGEGAETRSKGVSYATSVSPASSVVNILYKRLPELVRCLRVL